MRTRVAIALLACAACSSRKETVHREGSAAAVELVNTVPPTGSGGATKSSGSGGVTGPTTDEVEPNNTDDVATPLALGSTVRGRIDPEGDVDRYKIAIKDPGALALALSAPGGRGLPPTDSGGAGRRGSIDKVDLILELEDRDGNIVARSDRGGAHAREGIPNFGVVPGSYVAIVRAARAAKPKKGKAPDAPAPGGVYELTATTAAVGDGVEREPDDDRGTANDVLIGDHATGFVGWSGDVDVWKLSVETLSAHNAVDIELSAVDGVALQLEVSDGVGQVLLTRKAPRGAALTVRGLLPTIAAGAPPFHYLAIKGDRSNPETPYTLHVAAHLVGPDDEIEPNDTPEHAQPLPPDRTTIHATWTPGDVDCFALAPADVPHGVNVTIDASGDVDLSADLRVAGAVVASSAHPGRGAAEGLTATIPGKTPAVVCVRGAEAGATAGGTYDVVVRDGDDKPDNSTDPATP